MSKRTRQYREDFSRLEKDFYELMKRANADEDLEEHERHSIWIHGAAILTKWSILNRVL